MNTRNVDNVGIVIDHDEARMKHNDIICQCLADKKEYDKCLKTVCADLGKKEVAIIDKTFHPNTLKACTKILLKYWFGKLKGNNTINDYPLQRLLTHDARRQLLMWTLKQYK